MRSIGRASAAWTSGNYNFGTDGLFTLVTNFVTIQDNATKVLGKHELQFGFHSRLDRLEQLPGGLPERAIRLRDTGDIAL